MKIQLFSDFHLEKRDIIYPKPEADILVLAGDICEFDYLDSKRAFFMYVNLNWKKVIWILGNHEYYSAQSNIDIINTYIKGFISAFPNITILDRDIIEIDKYRILGCTLWSYISPNCEHLCQNAFSKLKVENKNITREYYNNLHKRDKEWLINNYKSDKDTIVITHFPTQQGFTENPKFNNDSQDIKNVYTNNLLLFLENKKLVCLSGHTHYNFYEIKNGVEYKCNQYGDLQEPCNHFDRSGIFEI